MKPVTITQSAAGTSQPIPVNWRGMNTFQLSLFCVLSSGSVMTYTVEHSPDNPQSFTDANDYNTNGNWFPTDGISGRSNSAESNIAFPVRAVRLNITSHTSGEAELTIIQSN